MNQSSHYISNEPDLLTHNSLKRYPFEGKSRFNKTFHHPQLHQSFDHADYQSSSNNPSIIDLNTLNFEDQSMDKSIFSFRKGNRSLKKQPIDSKRDSYLLYSETKNRYSELAKEISKKSNKVKVITKYNDLLLGQNPIRKYIKIEKLAANQKKSTTDKFPTQTLEKELVLDTKDQLNKKISQEKVIKQNIEQQEEDTKLQQNEKKYRTMMGKFRMNKTTEKSKKKMATLIMKKPTNEVPIRKPILKKKYFVFGMADRILSENKIENYRDLLWKINYSNGLYVSTPSTILAPYKACIGRGNNSCLIRGILKRRAWWNIVDKSDASQANFLWTQLKVNEFFVKQNQGIKRKYQSQAISQQINFKGIENERKIFGKRDIDNWKKHLMKNQKAQRKINQNTYIKRCNLLKKKKISTIQMSHNLRIHNHLKTNYYVGNKKALFYNLRKYSELKGLSLFQMIPITFHITSGVEDPEFKKFLSIFNEIEVQTQNKGPNIWIVKPGENTNQGNGITVCHSLDDILIRIKGRQRNMNGSLRTFIVQKYIDRPLLYHRRKFDIRHYMLVTCINGNFKAYWYEEGYVRTSSHQFILKNSKDAFIHLTNDSIQKNSFTYGKYEKANKLSYSDLQKYLQSNRYGKTNFFNTILPKMKHIGTQAIKATFSFLDERRLNHNFQLLGLDFMIDDDLNPWLIEFNTNPCLEMSCSLLRRLIPQMIQNVFKICIDPLFPPPQDWQTGKKLFFGENAISENRFELIFDETSDGQQIYNLYEKVEKFDSNMGKIEEDNECFEDDGEDQWDNDRH